MSDEVLAKSILKDLRRKTSYTSLLTKYGIDEARNRIYVTTDKARGALKNLSNEEEYETFVIPDNIGGRYSVLTAVGLLPIAVAGIDIDSPEQKAV